jgi:endonuclease G, mitochondrial
MRDICIGASAACLWRSWLRFLATSLTLFLMAGIVYASENRPIQRGAALSALTVDSICLAGCPRGAPAANRLIRRKNFAFSNNGNTKFADWVAYVVTPSRFGPPRQRNWRADPGIPTSETLEPEDYRGAHATIGTDRGHQVPLASFSATQEWRATNYLSNITPQKSALNQGPWARLEKAIRRLAKSSVHEIVYVATGPIYEKIMPSLPNADETHSVPSGYWKVVAMSGPGGLEAVGFVMDQDLSRAADFCAAPQRINLSRLVGRVGLRLFPDLDPGAFSALAESGPSMARRLGCSE